MYKPFEEMPGFARVWIYQANRKFTPADRTNVESALMQLCASWSAHGAPLHTSFRIEFDQFVILTVDERAAGASGCSIDGSVRILKDFQQAAGLDFFDRQQVAFLKGDAISLFPTSELKTLFENNVLSKEQITFNNAITTKAEWEHSWKVPVKDSWLSRYLPKTAGV